MPHSQWLITIADISLIAAFASAIAILLDIFVRGYRQKMSIMEWVWPITALYFGPIGLWAYWDIGRSSSKKQHKREGHHHQQGHHQAKKPYWKTVFSGTTHCGGGCTLGDIIAEWGVFLTGFTLYSSNLLTEYIFDFTLAFLLGIIFQYFAIAPMRDLTFGEGLKAAIKADTFSLIAFEIGLFGWMALMRFVFFNPPLEANDPVYWFMMQIGMVIGFATSYPMNWFLINKGIKEAM